MEGASAYYSRERENEVMSKTTVQQEDPSTPPPTERSLDNNLFSIGLIIVFGIFATTLPQPQVLGRLPITFFLKNELHSTKSQVSFFFLACGLFWYIKPLAGILTDAFPLFGTRRRSYMMVSSLLAAVSWIAIFLLPHTYNALLLGAIVVNLFMVMASTATGAYLVEAGQRIGATGRLTSTRILVQNICTFINGIGGGMLATAALAANSLTLTGGINGVLVFSLLPITYIFLKETRKKVSSAESFATAGNQLGIIFSSRTLWWAIFFSFLFYFSPGFGTVLTYRQSDELHMSPTFIGMMGTVGGMGGILAAIVYGLVIKFVNMRQVLYLGIALASISAVIYLGYNGKTIAPFIDFTNGFCYTFAEVALMDLMARSTPKGCEGLGYGLALSIRNLALFSADYVGSWLSDTYHYSFAFMVWLNTLTTLAVIVLIPFIPKVMLMARDKSAAEVALEEAEARPKVGSPSNYYKD